MKLSLIRSEFSTLIKLALPILISQLAQIGLNVSDVIFSGWAGSADLAGVALGSNFWLPISWLIIGFSIALTTLISFEHGKQRPDLILNLMQQSIYIAIILLIICLAAINVGDNFIAYFQPDAASFTVVTQYLQAFFFAIPGIIIMSLLRAFCDGQEKTILSMLMALFLLASNSILNYLLVFGKLGLPALGGAGCGVASAIASNVTALLFTLFLASKQSPLRLKLHLAPPKWLTVKIIAFLTIPISLALIIEASVFNLIAILIAKLGSQVVASHQIALTLISTSFMIPLSLSMALTIRVSFLQGASLHNQSKYSIFLALSISLSFGIALSLIYFLLPDYLVALFSQQDAVILLASELMLFAAAFQLIDCIQVTALGALRGFKETKIPLLIVMVSFWFIALPLGYLLSLTDWIVPALGVQGFWLALIIGLTLACIAYFWRLKKYML